MRPAPSLRPVLPSIHAWPLHDAAATRALEQAALARTAPHTLMARAGLAVARLALATTPHARRIVVLAGPGNNGGDGLVAARHLHAWGLTVNVIHLAADPQRLPDDARDALQAAQLAGVPISADLPPDDAPVDLVIDALLGLGSARAPEGAIARALDWANAAGAPVLAVDLPTGLDGDRGTRLGERAVRATHTLSLLTLKPGLFTAEGRDHAGRVWLDDLGVDALDLPPALHRATAWLSGPPRRTARAHAGHKGRFGDVVVIGGAPGLGGAAVLAADAALHAGGGRVYLGRLDPHAPSAAEGRPALMQRPLADLLDAAMLATATVVCGCGGGDDVARVLPAVLAHAARLVLDADALNAIAANDALRAAVAARADRAQPTIVTPHPLEAARLAGCGANDVQADRLGQAQALAEALHCVVVLKGSGSVIAAPGDAPTINPTGTARLGTAGSGDVLAGWIGGQWSSQTGSDPRADLPRQVAIDGVWWHGRAAEAPPEDLPLAADQLVAAMVLAVQHSGTV